LKSNSQPATLSGTGLLSALLLSAVLLLGACGVRTPPRPPENTAPLMTGQALATRNGDGSVTLSWKRPATSVDGTRLDDLAGFEIERLSANGEWEVITTLAVTDAKRINPRSNWSHTDTTAPPGIPDFRVTPFLEDGQRGSPLKCLNR
jgi:hypothetical protein